MLALAIGLGLVLGAIWGEAFGAVVGGLLAWLLVRTHRLERQVEALRRDVAAGPATAAAGVATSAPAAASTEPDAPSPPAVPEPGAKRPRSPQSQPLPLSAPQHSAAVAPALPRKPSLFDQARAWLFGGNTIVKAGVGILFVGLAFLAKFASEHVSVPVEWRLAGIAAVALALLALGWRLRLHRPAYAQVLQGGAVAALYLTLFAAFRFYGVLAIGPVFALMVAIAALAAALAVLQNARALAVIGALGGFATPLLLSTGGGQAVALFSYYLVLDGGIAAVAWFRTWRSLNLIGFAFTFVVATLWGLLRYTPADYATGQGFLIAFFLLFVAILLLPARRLGEPGAEAAPRADAWVNGSLLFGLPTLGFVLQHGLVRDTEYGTALSALALAAFYVALALAMRGRARLALTFEASLAIAVVFLTLVIPFALDPRSTAGAWALEAAGLMWLGFRQGRVLPRLFGLLLFGLAGAAMAWGQFDPGAPTSLLSAQILNLWIAAAGSLAGAWFVHRGLASRAAAGAEPTGLWHRIEPWTEPALIAWATLWALAGLAQGIDVAVASRYAFAAWLAGLGALATLVAALCARLAWPRLSWPLLAYMPALAFAVLATALTPGSPADDGGLWAWPLAVAAQLFVLWRASSHWPASLQHGVHALGVLVLAALGALQGRAVTADWGELRSAWAWLGWLAVPAAVLLALARPGAARRWPVRMLPQAYRGTAALVLTLGMVLWTLLANAVSNGSALPLPYVPLLNPLDLGVALALFAAFAGWRSDAAPRALVPSATATAAALGGAGFVWLNAMLIRGFHHFAQVPFRVEAWFDSLAVQTGLTLLWSVTALALMWTSARRTLRWPWMLGAALLAAVVLKLLLVDLSGTGTVTRIVSFIGVGALMLVIGYVAPLPSAAARHAAD